MNKRLETIKNIMPQYYFYEDDYGDIRYNENLFPGSTSSKWNPEQRPDQWKALVEYIASETKNQQKIRDLWALIRRKNTIGLMTLAEELTYGKD